MFKSYKMNMGPTVVFVMVSDQFHNEYKKQPLFI